MDCGKGRSNFDSCSPYLNQSPLQPVTETATFLHLFIAACCGWIFLTLARKIGGRGTVELDQAILLTCRRKDDLAIPRGPKWLFTFLHDITSLGSGTQLTLASAITVGFLCLRRRFRAAGFLTVSIGSGLLMSYLLKNFFLRERPTVVPRLTTFDRASFPSGHSMGAALVFLTLGGIVSRQTRSLLSEAYFLAVAVVLSILVGISRIYLGVHFPSDVLAGWAVGSFWSAVCTQLARWLQREGAVESPGTSIEQSSPKGFAEAATPAVSRVETLG
jgi:undecaprenyl-diphosphatase